MAMLRAGGLVGEGDVRESERVGEGRGLFCLFVFTICCGSWCKQAETAGVYGQLLYEEARVGAGAGEGRGGGGWPR